MPGMDISLVSGILDNIPGGLAQMVLMGEEIEEADVTMSAAQLLFGTYMGTMS